MADVLETGKDTPAGIAGETVQVTPARLAAISGKIENREKLDAPKEEADPAPESQGPIILDTLDNYDDLSWEAKFAPRVLTVPTELPSSIRTPCTNTN